MLKIIPLCIGVVFQCGLLVAQTPMKVLTFGEIKPQGWVYNQMLRDISSGNSSYLEFMRPLGAPITESDKGYGEFEGNFADCVIRNAILTGYKPWLDKAKNIAGFLLENQDEKGYVGRKRPDNFQELAQNEIELWSQCCFLRAFLAYYEYTKDPVYLNATVRSVDFMIKTFGDPANRYFIGETSMEGGARAHGLMYVDVLEKLYQLTGERRYVDFAFRLYEDYSIAINLKNMDNQKSYLSDPYVPFFYHAPHVAEHSRVVYWLASITDNPEYKILVKNNISKFLAALSPSGGLITDDKILESVGGKNGSPDLRYEYCSILESSVSFESAFQKSGQTELADIVENIVFNSAQAARLSNGKANAYCSKDNQYEAVGTPDNSTFRFQYAACHRIPCCVFNVNRVMPYYVANMWMKTADEKALVAAFYGPSVLSTRIAGINVVIDQETMYPFENNVELYIEPEKEKKFDVLLRIPLWSVDTRIEAEGATQVKENGYVRLTKKWKKGDRVKIVFTPRIEVRTANNNELYVRRGALLYALGFENKQEATREWPGSGFANYDVKLADPNEIDKYKGYKFPKGQNIKAYTDSTAFVYKRNPDASTDYPYDKPYGNISTVFLYQGKEVKDSLVPIGSVVLRRVTFPD
ncbi:MAG: glycoside hydrolase family 127 protein [Paludibacter sp.]|nr:glycoside hydrolase family 127 protein [Paludibacter sp.]